jgi:NAD(P)H-hydrate epimerase
LVPAYAARAPEAMWVGFPTSPTGGLALEGLHLVRERIERATALAIGPGLGREPETLALVQEILKLSPVPAVLDADALQPDLVRGANSPLVLTPHAGEFKRIAGDATLEQFAARTGTTVVLKGPVTQIASGATVYHSFAGGPVLARGGSGDLLAGIVGSLLAQSPKEPLLAAARGAVWHGLAADVLARAHGQTAVNTTQLLDYLPVVLREV